MPDQELTAREEPRWPLAEDFEAWFRESGIDFWSETNAPDELAKIVTRRIRIKVRRIARDDPDGARILEQMAEELER